MIERRLEEIAEDLAQVLAEAAEIKKNKLEPSPGLKLAIETLRKKQSCFLESLELWKAVFREYPNYDRS